MVVCVNNETIYAEAAARNVIPFGGLPLPVQWAEVRRDLDCLPAGALWWLRYHGRILVMCSGVPVTAYPGFQVNYDPTASGYAAGNVAIFSVDRSFPMTPHGVARGGTSVPLHELGHVFSTLLDGKGGTSGWPLWRQAKWQAVHPRINWGGQTYYSEQPWEAIAEAFALWLFARAGRRADVDPNILNYWDETARQAGWR